jgi:hypothetical protein
MGPWSGSAYHPCDREEGIMQTDNTTQDAQTEAVDQNDAEAMPRALSDLELHAVVGGLNFTKIECQTSH